MIEALYRSKAGETCAFFVRDAAALYLISLQKIPALSLLCYSPRRPRQPPIQRARCWQSISSRASGQRCTNLMPAEPLSVVTVGNLGIEHYKARDRVLNKVAINLVLSDEGQFYVLMRVLLATGCRIGEALDMADDHVTECTLKIPLTKIVKSHAIWLTGYAKAHRAAGWAAICYLSVWKLAMELDSHVD